MTEKDWTLKWLAWEITPRCNLNCVHCRSAAGKGGPPGIFTRERALDFLDQLAGLASPVVVMTGGEPLLREDLFEIMGYGTEKGFRMCMATNGTLLDDGICQSLKKAGIRMVSLSLDGATAAMHDDFRQQAGAFDGTLRGIEALKRHDIPFLINSSFTQRNMGDVEPAYRLAKKLGAKAWYMFIVVPVGRGKEIQSELLTPAQYRDLLQWHIAMEREEDDMLVRPTCAPQYYRLLVEAEDAGDPLDRRSLSFSTGGAKGCIAGQSIALVDAFGDVKPCSYFPEPAGNLNDQSLAEIWHDAKLFKDLRNFTGYGGVCGRCRHVTVCGGCRVRSYYVNGDFLGQDPLCIPAFGKPETIPKKT